MLCKVILGSQVPVLWSDSMGHVDRKPRACVNNHSVKFCMGLEEGVRHHPPFCGRSELHGADVRVQTPRPLHRGSETWKYTEFQMHTQNRESTSLLVH